MPDLPLKDLYLLCRVCRHRFLYTAEEQRRRYSKGQHDLPSDCPACRALERLSRRHTGQVDWYNRQRGYGFIKGANASSLFVHASDLRDAGRTRPAPGMRVSYLVQFTDKGPRAVDVEIIAEQG